MAFSVAAAIHEDPAVFCCHKGTSCFLSRLAPKKTMSYTRAMNWAEQRRIVVVSVVAGVLLLVLGIALTAKLYVPPSCVDNKQNQDETGVDCGGSCPYLCSQAQVAPVTLFSTVLATRSGRIDLAAAIENKNTTAGAKNVPFTVTLYAQDGQLVGTKQGAIDLPPRTIVPVFLPGIVAPETGAVRAFLEIAPLAPRWVAYAKDPRKVPSIAVRPVSGTVAAPRVEAVLTNASLTSLERIPVIAFVRDAATGNVIAASSTIIPSLAAQTSATALFVWNEAFTAPAVQVQVLPIISLP